MNLEFYKNFLKEDPKFLFLQIIKEWFPSNSRFISNFQILPSTQQTMIKCLEPI